MDQTLLTIKQLTRNAAEERQNGDARVSADDGDVDVGRVEALELANKGARAHHIERRHAKELLRVVDVALALQRLGNDRHGRVDRVGNHQNRGGRAAQE